METKTHCVSTTAYPCGTLVIHPLSRMKKPEPICMGDVQKKAARDRAAAMRNDYLKGFTK